MSLDSKSSFKTPLRFAIIGFGIGGANFHAPVIDSTPHCEVSAVVTRSEEKKRRISSEYPHARICSDVEEIWHSPDKYDVVVISTPNKTHVDFATEAIKAGLNVVIDKPMAPTFEDCKKLIVLSQKHNVQLTVFHNRRWDGDFLTVKQLIENSTLGEITCLESHFDRWRPQVKQTWRETASPDDAGGLLFDLGSHLIDQAVNLFGRPRQIYAESHTRRAGASADDENFLSLTFENDIRAHLYMTNLAAIQPPRFRLQGLKGTYEKYGMDPQEEALKAGKRPKSVPNWGEEEKSAWGKFACERDSVYFEGIVKTVPGDYVEFYRKLRLSITDGAPLPVSAEDAAWVVKLIEAAKLSAAESRIVDVSP